jgi:uncharacterized protein YjbI with pentapeptide repeats
MRYQGLRPKVRVLGARELSCLYLDGERDFRRVIISDRLAGYTFVDCDFAAATFGHNISAATFIRCNFTQASLVGELMSCSFTKCDFTKATFRVNLQQVRYDTCVFVATQIGHGVWDSSAFASCDFSHASLVVLQLDDCRFVSCHWQGARILDAIFRNVAAHDSNLREVEFSGTQFRDVTIARCVLDHVHLAGVSFMRTPVGAFCEADGVRITPPLNVDWESMCLSIRSPGLERLLLNAQIPEVVVTYTIDCARALDPAEMFNLMLSTFISYGAPDVVFARRLRDALQANGVRTFLFETDAIPGERLHRVMHDAVHTHDRVILICSEQSLLRPGVRNEIEQTLAREARDGGSSYLLPVAIDDHIYLWKSQPEDLAVQVRDRVVADFRNTVDDRDRFGVALAHLLRALSTKR